MTQQPQPAPDFMRNAASRNAVRRAMLDIVGGGPGGACLPPLAAIRATVIVEADARAERGDLIQLAREAGHAWAEIGHAVCVPLEERSPTMADGVSHLHIVCSTGNEEIIRGSGPLDADAARQEFDLGYPAEFEAVFSGARQWEVAEHGDGQWTSVGWCLGACAETASLLHAFAYFPWLPGQGGVKFPPQPAARPIEAS
jgi:hypothetical protein